VAANVSNVTASAAGTADLDGADDIRDKLAGVVFHKSTDVILSAAAQATHPLCAPIFVSLLR